MNLYSKKAAPDGSREAANKIIPYLPYHRTEELYRMLDVRADELGVSKNALILQILWDYVEKRGE